MGRKKLGDDSMKCIYLIGFMGSGKTTIGRALGAGLNLSVIDTDKEITLSTQRTISDIFQKDGEEYFRQLEADCLKKLPSENIIITTGGGMILREDNRLWMKEKGYVIFLHTSAEEVITRLKDDQTRPLLQDKQISAIKDMLTSRLPLYMGTANLIVDTTGRTVESIVTEIIQGLEYPTNGHTD